MDRVNHNKNVIEVCKNFIEYVGLHQDYLSKDNLLKEHKAISDEFKEWLKKVIKREALFIEFTK